MHKPKMSMKQSNSCWHSFNLSYITSGQLFSTENWLSVQKQSWINQMLWIYNEKKNEIENNIENH